MTKLNVVIADSDEAYLEGLLSYMTSAYPGKFHIHCFTEKDYLDRFLDSTDKKIDIIAVSPDLVDTSFRVNEGTAVALLSPGKADVSFNGYEVIHKYQTGEKLVGILQSLYLKKIPKEEQLAAGNVNTKVVGIYSPAGGSGKSTIAAACSMASAAKGLRTFYLNLEDIQSTSLYFQCESENNLSQIFYFIKEKYHNIGQKMEDLKVTDPLFPNLYYFCPPDSGQEIGELDGQEIGQLINSLKSSQQYEWIFIDMCSRYQPQNAAVWQVCDNILLIMQQDLVSGEKAMRFMKEMEIIRERTEEDLTGKFIPVMNKYNACMPVSLPENLKWDQPHLFSVPFAAEIFEHIDNRTVINMNTPLGDAVEELITSLGSGSYRG